MTHVVTSRPIPPESDATSPTESNTLSAEQATADGPHTVNPSLLEKSADSHVSLKGDTRREKSSMDVLQRARQMGMKIWALEKLQRMISAINDGEIGGHGHSTRSNNTGGGIPKGKGENDLSQVLRNELVNGPSDRDPFSSTREMIMFKGPFIYIHDMDERTKPVMVRDYPKVARRQDGPWPQFRSAPIGKCPFVEEPPTRRGSRQRTRQQAKEKKPACKPVPQNDAGNQHYAEPERAVVKGDAHQGDKKEAAERHEEQAATLKLPEKQLVPVKQESPKKSSGSFIPPHVPRAGPFFMGREPAASGVQPSNVTSAIRSQMISSATAAHGAKAAVSKEVHELKRKVLEKGNGGVPTAAAAPTHRPAEPSAGLRTAQNAGGRPGKVNAQERPGHANEEDTTQSEGNGATKRRFDSQKGRNPNEERRRDPKPGYCENCREKFDDFDDVSSPLATLFLEANCFPAYQNEKASQVCDDSVQLGRTGFFAVPTGEAPEAETRILLSRQARDRQASNHSYLRMLLPAKTCRTCMEGLC